MDISRRQILKSVPVGASIGLAGCSAGGSNTATLKVEYDDCWAGHFGAKTGDGQTLGLSINGDGRDGGDTTGVGSKENGVWSVTVPDDVPQADSIQSPLGASATIRNHTTCDGGDAREWSDSPLTLTLRYNGETVGTDTAQGKGNEASVEHRP